MSESEARTHDPKDHNDEKAKNRLRKLLVKRATKAAKQSKAWYSVNLSSCSNVVLGFTLTDKENFSIVSEAIAFERDNIKEYIMAEVIG